MATEVSTYKQSMSTTSNDYIYIPKHAHLKIHQRKHVGWNIINSPSPAVWQIGSGIASPAQQGANRSISKHTVASDNIVLLLLLLSLWTTLPSFTASSASSTSPPFLAFEKSGFRALTFSPSFASCPIHVSTTADILRFPFCFFSYYCWMISLRCKGTKLVSYIYREQKTGQGC